MTATWHKMSLAQKFALAGGLVLLLGMAVIGVWVTRRIEDGVTRNAGIAGANYVDSVIAPLIDELAASDTLSLGARRALEEKFSSSALGEELVSFKIWKNDGLIVFSSHPELVGRKFEVSEKLRLAWGGQIVVGYDDLEEEENALERARGQPLLEIYTPIRAGFSGTVIGVAEFYERAIGLEQELNRTRAASWIVVATVTATMMGLLFGIVLRGSRTIEEQRLALSLRVDALSDLVAKNEDLQARLRRASGRATELNERFLRRISAELHDGPAQHLGLAAMRLDRLERDAVRESARAELPAVREALTLASREIRLISQGLALPELANADLNEVLRMAATAHELRTDTEVTLDLPKAPPPVSIAAKICIHRFAQETLNNAFRHGGGVDQRLTCRIIEDRVEITVSDGGPGFDTKRRGEGLGLPGLRERIASLGGDFEIESRPGAGVRARMSLETRDYD